MVLGGKEKRKVYLEVLKVFPSVPLPSPSPLLFATKEVSGFLTNLDASSTYRAWGSIDRAFADSSSKPLARAVDRTFSRASYELSHMVGIVPRV